MAKPRVSLMIGEGVVVANTVGGPKRAASGQGGKGSAEGVYSAQAQPDIRKTAVAASDFTSKDYIDARIEATEARAEARHAEIMGEIRHLSATLNSRMDVLDGRTSQALDEARLARQAAVDAERAAKGSRWNILFTGLSLAAIIFAVFAVWVQGVEMTAGLSGVIKDAIEAATAPQ